MSNVTYRIHMTSTACTRQLPGHAADDVKYVTIATFVFSVIRFPLAFLLHSHQETTFGKNGTDPFLLPNQWSKHPWKLGALTELSNIFHLSILLPQFTVRFLSKWWSIKMMTADRCQLLDYWIQW